MEVLFHCKIAVSKFGILKNSKQIFINRHTNRPFISKSDRAKALEKELTEKFIYQKLKQKVDTIECDVVASMVFHYPKTVYYTKKGVRNSKLGDIDNLLGTPFDCLQKAKVLANDNLITGLSDIRRLPIDSTQYFLEIILIKDKL